MAINPLTLLDGTTAYATDVEAKFNPLYTDIAPINVQASNKIGTGRFVLESAVLTLGGVPIGSTIPFYDFNGLVSFDPTIWRYCNGSLIVAVGSPINGQTLPDLSGRCIVGFGTPGGGNIGTAPWATPAVGNPNHQINIQHTHTGPSHSHSIPSHSHTISSDGSHNHGGLTNQIAISIPMVSYPYMTKDDTTGWGTNDPGDPDACHIRVDSGYADEAYHDHNISSDGTHSHGGATGGTSLTTDPSGTGATGSALSTTQSIQPDSIRFRFIMRVL